MCACEEELILAPMVRVGTLPMRLLALSYGASRVYTEEIIDLKLQRSKRRVNDVLGTVDYIDQTDGTVVFRTCAAEKPHVILQLGTARPESALQVAKMVENDVAGVDINMGCPKKFSISGGMGAALLSDRERAKSILKTLVDNLSIPVSCKIRICSTKEATLEMVREFISTGIKIIAVHGRTVDERPQHFVHADIIKYVRENVDIPVIANGGSKEIEKHSDIAKFRTATGCSKIMLARAAEWNCSIFRKDGLLPLDDVIVQYLKLAVDYDNSPSNSKYCIQNMLGELQDTPRGKKFLECQTHRQICAIWNLEDYCQAKEAEFQANGIQGRWEVCPEALEPPSKRTKLDDLEDAVQFRIRFLRSNYTNDLELPKTVLHAWAGRKGLKLPKYETEQREKLFRSVVTFDDKRYASKFWEKNKKFAEQGGALVCLCALEIVPKDDLIKNGSLL